ncbi:hypothetical protein IPZ58_32035 [Streptomyces roseoverticillatus]|nr:hypothetical protein [Streptomyces roseoverticillatus]MCF3106167.1 hypothetical protein [Streptomyces roseoverticillatus]
MTMRTGQRDGRRPAGRRQRAVPPLGSPSATATATAPAASGAEAQQ